MNISYREYLVGQILNSFLSNKMFDEEICIEKALEYAEVVLAKERSRKKQRADDYDAKLQNDIKLSELMLSTRVRNLMESLLAEKNPNVEKKDFCISHLLECTETDFLRFPGFGKISLNELNAELKYLNREYLTRFKLGKHIPFHHR